MKTDRRTISAEEALGNIRLGTAIENAIVNGRLDMTKLGMTINTPCTFRNSIIEDLCANAVEYLKPVIIESSQVMGGGFAYAYFKGGLIINNCTFEKYIDFEAGGHNTNPITIANSSFGGFVNFFDCWFMEEISVFNNNFLNGTNLLGNKGQSFEVQFDKTPTIENNTGKMDWDGDGGKQMNVINLVK